MSAFMVEPTTIVGIVHTLASLKDESIHWSWIGEVFGEAGFTLADLTSEIVLMQQLYELNRDAVCERYGKERAQYPPVFPGITSDWPIFSRIQLIKSLHCLHYQCDEMEDRPLYKLLERVITYTANAILCEMPEYKAALWE